MKRGLILSWVFFALAFAARGIADDFRMVDAQGRIATVDTIEIVWNGPLIKYSVHLDDSEIDRIREACR